MKSLIFFFLSGISAITCYSQDTLVDSKGLIFPARITAVDSNFITYAAPDTLLKDQMIVPRSSIIFIKYQGGKTEQLYVSDTLITKEGLFITCKVLEIDAKREDDGTHVVVYRRQSTGEIWVRPYSEFVDKFTNIP